MIYTKRADFYALSEKYGISPVTARIMINRGIPEADFPTYLHGTLTDLHDPFLLSETEECAQAILEEISEGQKIRIVGDYDIDGVCSTFILYRILKQLGAEVTYEIPDRIRDGYGINTAIINAAYHDGIDMILTCDNGISAREAIALAQGEGMFVCVTDHHEVPKNEDGEDLLPDADFIVNPKKSDENYPFREICGGMVAFKLAQVLCAQAGLDDSAWECFIPYAAIATIGDVMPLCDENRVIVKEGLKRLAFVKDIGIRKLIEVCGLDIREITAYHIGFVVGPCLNAGGRLESAKTALRLLLSEDENEAEMLAVHLKQLNDERKNLTEEYSQIAAAQVDELYPEDDVKVIYLPDCHESVAGIIAGRIRERYNHPVIVLTDSEGGIIKGSARSIDDYNIFEKISEVSDLLLKFGGHKLAAGLSLEKDNIDRLRTELNRRSGLSEASFKEKLWIDVAMPFEYATEQLIDELKLLEPYGQGNEKPAFAQKGVQILSAKAIGKLRNAVRLRLRCSSGTQADALLFTDADSWFAELGENRFIDVIYYPQVNEYMGRKTVQIVVKNWKISATIS